MMISFPLVDDPLASASVQLGSQARTGAQRARTRTAASASVGAVLIHERSIRQSEVLRFGCDQPSHLITAPASSCIESTSASAPARASSLPRWGFLAKPMEWTPVFALTVADVGK